MRQFRQIDAEARSAPIDPFPDPDERGFWNSEFAGQITELLNRFPPPVALHGMTRTIYDRTPKFCARNQGSYTKQVMDATPAGIDARVQQFTRSVVFDSGRQGSWTGADWLASLEANLAEIAATVANPTDPRQDRWQRFQRRLTRGAIAQTILNCWSAHSPERNRLGCHLDIEPTAAHTFAGLLFKEPINVWNMSMFQLFTRATSTPELKRPAPVLGLSCARYMATRMDDRNIAELFGLGVLFASHYQQELVVDDWLTRLYAIIPTIPRSILDDPSSSPPD